MRQTLGVCKTTPVSVMMRDLHRYPLAVHWLSMIVGFWNRAVRRPADDYLHIAMRENVELAENTTYNYRDRQRLWAYHFIRCMAGLGCEWRGEGGTLKSLNIEEVVKAAVTKWHKHEWAAVEAVAQDTDWARSSGGRVVHAAPQALSGFKQLVYQQWFAEDAQDSDEQLKWVRYTFTLKTFSLIRIMAQYRLGSHWLGVQQGRFRGVPRAERVCPRCRDAVEDELHLFSCPLYSRLREKYGITGPTSDTDSDIRSYMNTIEKGFSSRLAKFLLACRELRLMME